MECGRRGGCLGAKQCRPNKGDAPIHHLKKCGDEGGTQRVCYPNNLKLFDWSKTDNREKSWGKKKVKYIVCMPIHQILPWNSCNKFYFSKVYSRSKGWSRCLSLLSGTDDIKWNLMNWRTTKYISFKYLYEVFENLKSHCFA